MPLKWFYRMKIAIVDITGRNASQYNPSLCKALAQIEGVNVTLISPTLSECNIGYSYKKLLKIIPDSLTASEGKIKRILRLLEVLLNYSYLILIVLLKRPDIIHIQWLPLLEFASGESLVLKMIKIVSSNTRIVLTVHNIYPHNMTEARERKYHNRFLKLDSLIDAYIVHLYSSKHELATEFSISENKIHVAYHGIYVADKYRHQEYESRSEVKRIIMFGYQNYYKGTDLLIEALKILPETYLSKIKVKIVGKTEANLFERYQSECNKLNIEWNNNFVPEEELYEAIDNSDLILLPYRSISQSGVLLLALSYRKPIITSDLPSFKETLDGYPNDHFFKADDKNALAGILRRYLDGQIDENKMKYIIEKLNIKYSWTETGKSTKGVYDSCLRKNC